MKFCKEQFTVLPRTCYYEQLMQSTLSLAMIASRSSSDISLMQSVNL